MRWFVVAPKQVRYVNGGRLFPFALPALCSMVATVQPMASAAAPSWAVKGCIHSVECSDPGWQIWATGPDGRRVALPAVASRVLIRPDGAEPSWCCAEVLDGRESCYLVDPAPMALTVGY